MLGDPAHNRSTQLIEVATNMSSGASTVQGGIDGAGPMGSEIAMPLVPNTSYNAAMIVYA